MTEDENKSAGDVISGILNSQEEGKRTALANKNNNNIPSVELVDDLTNLSRGQLIAKHGIEAERKASVLRRARQDIQRQSSARRSVDEIILDSTKSAAKGFVGLGGSLTSLGLSGAAKVVNPFDTGTPDILADTLRRAAAKTSNLTEKATSFIEDTKSDDILARKELSNIAGELDAADTREEYNQNIANGNNAFIEGTKRVGKDILGTTKRVLSDPAVAGELIAEGIGSLGPSAKIASFGQKIGKEISEASTNAAVQKVAPTLGASVGVGVSEASGAYTDALNTVLDTPHETLLLNSPDYVELIENGTSEADAKLKIADSVGQIAFARQLPVAASLGLLSSKFEASPLKVFKNTDLADKTKNIISQGAEEALQGGSSTLNVNSLIKSRVDSETDILDGVGESVATGAIAGIGLAGALAAPSAVGQATSKVANKAKHLAAAPETQELASKAAQASVRSILDGVDGASSVAKKAIEKAKPVTEPLKEKVISPAIQKTKEVIEPGLETLNELANRSNSKVQQERIVSAQKAQTIIQSQVSKDKTLEPLTTKTDKIIPETFKASVPENSTPIENVTGILNELSNKKTKIDKLSNSDLVFINNSVNELRDATQNIDPFGTNEINEVEQSELSELFKQDTAALKKELSKVLSSPDIAKVQKRIKAIDLNDTQTSTGTITPETVSTSVNVAKINPANVNPDVANKILEQSDDNDLSDEDIRLLGSASKIAQAVNNHRGQQVQISNDTRIALSQNPTYKADPKKLPQEQKLEDVSRSIQVGGFTDKRGKRLRSVNDFAADIFQGIQNPKSSEGDYTFTNSEGNTESAQDIAEQFEKFVTHFSNKVDALNTSVQSEGKSIGFRSLVGGEFFKNPGEAGAARPVFVRTTSPKSVELAKKVHNDAVVAAEVFNILVDTNPSLFPNGKIKISDLNLEPTQETNNVQEQADQQLEDERIAKDKSEREILDKKAKEEFAEQNDPDNSTIPEDLKSEREVLDDNFLIKFDKNNAQKQSEKYLEGTEFENADTFEFDVFEAKRILDNPKLGAENFSEAIDVLDENNIPKTYLNLVKINEYIATASSNKLTKKDYENLFNISKTETISEVQETKENNNDRAINRENQVQDISNEDTTEENSNDVVQNLPELFTNTYSPKNNEITYETGQEVLDAIEGEKFKAFAQPLLKTLTEGANRRLETVKFSKSDPRSIKEVILSDTDQLAIRDFKNTALVDQTTGEYDARLLELASVSVIDWLSSVVPPHPSRLGETIEDLGGTIAQVSKTDQGKIIDGVFVRQTIERLAKDVLNIWDVSKNIDAPMVNSRGIVEGLVKELITVLSNDTNLISLNTIKVDGKVHQIIDASNLRDIQKDLGLIEQNSVKKLVNAEDVKLPSIGQKIKSVATTQSFGDVELSAIERNTLRNMQDTPHFVSEGISSLVNSIGFDKMAELLGYQDLSNFRGNDKLLASLKGKNASIDRNLQEAFLVYDTVNELREGDEDIPVYYPVSISKVGRHQFVGINPQNNKILRDMVTPTKSTLDMVNNQNHIDNFRLTVSQASGLNKVENENHTQILSTIKEEFNDKFGKAVSEVENFLITGEINSDIILEVMGTNSGMEALNSVFAVASLNFAHKNNSANAFETTLAFELDGKTDGPANMMSNFGQGELTPSDYKNFNRVGLFLGRAGKTLNDYFQDGRGDLYVTTAKRADEILATMPNTPQLKAITRFASQFGEFKMTDNGQIEMVRNNAKNPMTKVVYKSGLKGVGDGIADELVLGLYETLYNVPSSVNLKDIGAYLGYPTILQDIELLFGKLPNNFDPASLEFTKKALDNFSKEITKTIGDALFRAAKDVIGAPISDVNDTLVYASQIQAEFVSRLFDKRFEELVQSEKDAGRIKSARELTEAQYNKLVDDIRIYAPLYSNGSQTLSVGSFSNQAKHNIELSSNMEGNLRQKSSLLRPEEAKVKIIPYLSIGRGDAMMMNRFYGDNTAPLDTLPIFDGINIPIDKISDYAARANEQVLNNWDQDVLIDVVNDFESFLRHVNDPELEAILAQSFAVINYKSKGISTNNGEELLDIIKDFQQQNAARKQAFQEIPISVDHMGGSNTSFSRNENQEDISLSDINRIIDEKLTQLKNETDEVTADERYTELSVSTGQASVEALLLETKDTNIRKSIRAIQNKIPDDLKVITGSLDQLNEYRQELLSEDDGQYITTSGSYDPVTKTVFINKNSTETLVHELIHASTYNQVLAHYEGETNPAVTRLETLMDEFLGLNLSTSSETVQQNFRNARQAIIKKQAGNDVYSKAAALNEFMAWTLSNEQIAKTLKTTRSNIIVTLTNKVKNLMRKLMGGVPNDIFSNILFNTKLLDNNASGNGGDISDNNNNNNGDNNSDGNVTPPASEYTNFWIDLLKQKVADAQELSPNRTEKQTKLVDYNANARKALDTLAFEGITLSHYEKRTFEAIHMVLATEMRLDPQSALAMGRIYQHVTSNLSPEMFSGSNAESKFSAVMNLFGSTQNDEGVSDSMAVLFALSQTSKEFRDVLDNIPDPETNDINLGSLNQFLSTSTAYLMRKLVGEIDTSNPNITDVIDALSENLIKDDNEENFRGLRTIMKGLDKADTYVKGALEVTSEKLYNKNEEIQDSNRSDLTKAVVSSVTLASSFLTNEKSAIALEGIKGITHFGQRFDKFVPLQEFVSNLVGSDKYNRTVVALLDRTNKAVSSIRQAYREELPLMFQQSFNENPTKDQWKALHNVIGKTDIAFIYDIRRPSDSLRLLTQDRFLDRTIKDREDQIKRVFSRSGAKKILQKSNDLAAYMNDLGAGHNLQRNAYAINKLSGEYNESMTKAIDELVSLYAYKHVNSDQKEAVRELINSDPQAVRDIVTYIQALNKEEDIKNISEAARLNGYKGYIPNHGKQSHKIIIDSDDKQDVLIELGYVRVADYVPEGETSLVSRGYYTTTIDQEGNYSQGVLQNVQDTYKGVDATTGLSVNGTTSGVISGQHVRTLFKNFSRSSLIQDKKNVLLPVYNEQGGVEYYERGISPDLIQFHQQPESNIALMIGAWAGRQIEEKFAQDFNNKLVDEIKKIHDQKLEGDDALYVNIADPNITDPIYKDSWKVIPVQTKKYIESVFGPGNFPIKKDIINTAVGFREPTIVDVWTGKSRLPVPVRNAIKIVSKRFFGDRATKVLSITEKATQSVISTAKDIIVVRSLVVPYLNTQSNIFQLNTRGVGTKNIIKGYKDKFSEIETYNENVRKVIRLEAQQRVSRQDPNKVRVLKGQIQAIKDENQRMSIAPMVEAGAYKNISEGMTDLDVELTKNNLGQWIDSKTDKLPSALKTAGKYAILSKDTEIYKMADKAVQYGDFLAKSIYYDHLVNVEGMSEVDAIDMVSEEFVNFSVPLGRTHSYLESLGVLWFQTFKIKITKTAFSIMRNNPVRALLTANTVGDLGSPVNDNLLNVIKEGRLDYSVGWEMLMGSPELNPWVNLADLG